MELLNRSIGFRPPTFGIMITKQGVEKRGHTMEGDRRGRGLMIEWKASAKDLSTYKGIIGGVRAPTVTDPLERKILEMN